MNFLQTRDPPILPTLQQQPELQPKFLAGVNVAFDHNVESYKDFGSRNKSSLGELLFHFFRYYGHEFDFEQSVVSLRLGRILPKTEKAWHLLQDNRLCVEEPFNLSRNLANTADDTSMRGIHQELRRAYDLIGAGNLETACEQFIHPPDEIKPSEHFIPPASRPVIPQPPTQPSRGGRNGGRGGRHSNQMNRNSNGRRASNPSGRSSSYLRNLPFQMTTQELQLQAQHQQHLLHDQLFQQYQYLQLQEQELRMQLHQQNLRQRGLLAAAYGQPAGYFHYPSQEDGVDFNSSVHMNGIARAPLSAPLYQHRFSSMSPYLQATQPSQGIATNPPSPRLNSVIPDTRRYSRRTSVTQSTSGPALRAHSQPARAVPLSSFGHMMSRPEVTSLQEASMGRRSSASSGSQDHFPGYAENGLGLTGALHDTTRRPAEYLGYYVGQSPSLSAYTQSTAISPIPAHVGLAIQHGGLSPRLASSTRSASSMHTPPLQTVPPIPIENHIEPEAVSENVEGGHLEPLKARSGPLIVDGSINSPRRRRTNHSFNEPDDQMNFSASTSEDLAFDTPSSSDEQSQDALDFTNHTERSPPGSPGTARKLVLPSGTPPEFVNGYAPPRPFVNCAKEGSEVRVARVGDSIGMPALTALKKSGNTAWPLDRQLSSVEEVRTPSPRVETFNSDTNSPKVVNAPASQNQTSSSAVSLAVNGGEIPGDLDKPLAPRTNGIVGPLSPASNGAVHVNGTSGWQTQKKKRKNKKTVKSENDAHALNVAGGESLPADESLRKGG